MSLSTEKLSWPTIDSDKKRYEEIKNLTLSQDKDYTTGCLLDYE